jgi:hypothetical protein
MTSNPDRFVVVAVCGLIILTGIYIQNEKIKHSEAIASNFTSYPEPSAIAVNPLHKSDQQLTSQHVNQQFTQTQV